MTNLQPSEIPWDAAEVQGTSAFHHRPVDRTRTFPKRNGVFQGYHWSAVLVFALVLFQITSAYVLGSRVFGTRLSDVLGFFHLRSLNIWLLIPLLWITQTVFLMLRKNTQRPLKTLFRWMRYRYDWFARGLLLISAYPSMALSFSITKATIPKTVGFFADPYLVHIDRILAFGSDPWRITHELLPPVATVFLDRTYLFWFPYLTLMICAFSFSRNAKFQMQSALAFFLCWAVLGVICATAMASVGPIFYDQIYGVDYFEELLKNLTDANEKWGLVAKVTADFLVKNAGSPKLGVGISAMPSMHVSMAFLGFLMALQFNGKLWLKVFTGAFSSLVLIASVQLGWHYFADGIVSLFGTYALWRFAGWFGEKTFKASAVACEIDADRSRSHVPTK